MSAFSEAKALDDTYLMHTYGRLPVEFVGGHDAVLVDSEGREYLDCLAGIGCMSLGHNHPAMVTALQDQAAKLWQVGNYFYEENRGEAAQAVSGLLSATTDEVGHVTGRRDYEWKLFFANSGGEANEGAIKLARRWGELHLDGAYTVLSARRSFHGRTLATLAATGQDAFHAKFTPMPAGFDHVELNDLSALEAAVEGGGACAVMLECVQGEGGVWPATLDYLRGVEAICRQSNLLLIIDEVQTGFYRCGAPFSYQRAGIEPDVVSMAKGIGGGFPMGAFAAHGEVAELLVPGDHGSTFGGNALAAAASRTAVATMQKIGLGEHVIATGERLAAGLATLPHVTEVRGAGLLRGAQLDVPIASRLVDEGLAAGLVLNHIGDSILRFLPPLVITDEQVDEVIRRLRTLL